MSIKRTKITGAVPGGMWYTIMVTGVLLVLMGVGLLYLWRSSRVIGDIMIAQEVVKLRDIFKKIDQTCGIIGFEHQRNYIDFLTVKAFVSSEVGAMNLANPGKWQGPYLQDNPTVQEKLYEIVLTKNGYYIVPGDGVTLSNGKVIGKDILFNATTVIEPLLGDKQALNFKGQALAAKLEVKLLTGRSENAAQETGLQKTDLEE